MLTSLCYRVLHLILTLVLSVMISDAGAQTLLSESPDTENTEAVDTDENNQRGGLFRSSDTPPDPGTAALYSTILPGTGQAYNGKYFKIPLIYLLGAGLYWGFDYHHDRYSSLRDAYHIRTDDEIDIYHPDHSDADENPTYATTQQLISAREFYRRNRDLFAIGLGLLYILNIVDAYVDAHLYEFDVSDDLTLRLNFGNPVINKNNPGQSGTGISLNF